MLEVEPLLLRAVATLQVWRPYESESQLSPYGRDFIWQLYRRLPRARSLYWLSGLDVGLKPLRPTSRQPICR
jgi:hypothetical protein